MRTEIKTRKTVPLSGGAEAHINLLNGESVVTIPDLNDSAMGVGISHILHLSGQEENAFCCGENMRLNLHEKFVKTNGEDEDVDYVYTDCMGDTFSFKEYFYYVGADKKKQRVSKEDIRVAEDGTITYTDEAGTYIVEREITTYDGMKASTKLEGVKNLQYYDQRGNELKQAEEQSQSYKDVLYNYVLADEHGNIQKELGKNGVTLSALVEGAKNASCVLSKSEAVNLRYLDETRIHLDNQTSYDYLLKRSNTNTRNIDKMVKDAENSEIETCHSYMETICDYIVYNAYQNTVSEIDLHASGNEDRGSIIIANSHLKNGKMFDKYYTEGVTSTEFVLHRNELNNYYSCLAQLVNVRAQIDMLKETGTKNKEKIEEYYAEYLAFEEKANQLRFQTPVSFVKSEKGARGFNENGDLVVLYNKNGEYIAFEYEKYFVGNDVKHRIIKIYDSKERAINLAYSDKTNLLCEMTDCNGKIVKYEYLDNKINKIIYPNGYTLEFDFDGGILRITDSYDIRSELIFVDSRMSQIVKSTKVTSVENGNVASGAEVYREIFKNSFNYNSITNTSVITDNENVSHYYVFDRMTERLVKYLEEKENVYLEEKPRVVTKAQRYEFLENAERIYRTINAKKSTLYTTPLNSFVFEDEDYSQKTITERSKLMDERQYVREGNVEKRTLSQYEYNIDDKVIKKTINYKVKLVDGETLSDKTFVELYEYNSFGSIVRKQAYVEGEEATNGIDIEEHVYDDNGFEIKTVKYNSLDPSSKLYSERELDENGQVSFELEPTGRYRTSYKYETGNSTVLSEIYPNGSCYSYGYSDIDGNSAITVSTKDGEENSIQIMRTNGLPTKVKADDVEFGYTYDYKGRKTSVNINGLVLANMEYEEMNDSKVSSVYEKGETVITTTDLHGNVQSVVKVVGADRKAIVNEHDTRERVGNVVEELNDKETCSRQYIYDDLDRVTACLHKINGTICGGEGFVYDSYGSIAQRSLTTVNGNTTYNYTYSNDSKRKLTQVKLVEDNIVITPTTDSLARNVRKAVSVAGNEIINDKISYLKNGSHATSIPVSIKHKNGDTVSYKYDRMGNITKIFENGVVTTEYEYDKLCRLTRENNKKLNETTVFKYDNRGNILSKSVYAYTRKSSDELEDLESEVVDYEYGVLDYISKYGADDISYDIFSGQPYNWRFNEVVFNGKEMVSFGANTFGYDVAGRRTRKNQITYDYDVNGRLVRQSNGISFIYDHNSLIGFKYENAKYFYRKDILGNIVAILDSDGAVVVKYTYNAWGNHTYTGNEDLATINPYRYRGYYYDTETGLYFLKTRYYDPFVCRFISMDDVAYIDPETIGGLNLFAYCGNDPVNRCDPSGHAFISALVGLGIAALIGAGVAASSYTAGQLIDYAKTGDFEWSWGGFFGSIIGGAVGGMIAYALPWGAIGAFFSGAATTAGTMIGQNITDDAGYSTADILLSSVISGAFSAVSVGVMSKIRISGFNAGRGSYSAVSAQIYTKFRRQIISRITINTFGKMFAVEAYNGIAGAVLEDAYDYLGVDDLLLN